LIHPRNGGRLATMLVCGLMAATSAQALELQPADAVLARLAQRDTVEASRTASPAAALMKDIAAYRSRSSQLAPPQAAAEWLSLWDRALAMGQQGNPGDLDAYDTATRNQAGPASLLASLPSPEAWPALRAEGVQRAAKAPASARALGLRLLGEVLTRDVAAARQSLAAFERLAAAAGPDEREAKLMIASDMKALLYKLYGSREEIAAAFSATVDAHARQSYPMDVIVPDLVGLLGAAKAETLLADALKKPVSLWVPEGEATKALARRLALREVSRLRRAQWALIDSVGTAPLYEAMRARFDPRTTPGAGAPAEDADPANRYERRQADLYYFLDLVIAKRHAEAERAMLRATSGRGDELDVPRRAMAELARRGENAAVHAYLSQLLARRPQAPAWDFFLEQAGVLGRTRDAIALLDTILKRSDLTPYLRATLNEKRLEALLADDQVDAAVAGYRALLSAPPSREDPKLEQRTTTALRVAALGRVLKQPAWSQLGLDYAAQAVALAAAAQSHWRPRALQGLLAELRRQSQADVAQGLALAELDRESAQRGFKGMAAVVPDAAKQAALVELAGLYDAAGRTQDVQRLMDEVGIWGAGDLAQLVIEKDSMGTPLGLMAARALKAQGRVPAATAAARAVMAQWPNHDPAYQLFVELAGQASIAELDRLAARDPFEERPLVWKAALLKQAGQYESAEESARRAIAIDPSDGEQGANDRMRAYAVLADILAAKGDAKAAQVYQRAVAAIRQSEQADELHRLGLLQRAFAGYRAALAEFSDAYCIQSRLAVQLGKAGFHDEALKHYRRAFELMPDSFGRVESHCFGCESVFAGPGAQAVADEVFTRLVSSNSAKPQAPYMLAYLRKEQGRYEDAVVLFRRAIAMDALYLSAWRQLNELGEKTYIDAAERDIARLRLLELDPNQQHVRYQLNEVADLTALWHAIARRNAERAPAKAEPVYALAGSIRARREVLETLPPDMRLQIEQFVAVQRTMAEGSTGGRVPASLANHKLLNAALRLMGITTGGNGE
jgi:tetratricopeptide (TPR) repeat protein